MSILSPPEERYVDQSVVQRVKHESGKQRPTLQHAVGLNERHNKPVKKVEQRKPLEPHQNVEKMK